MSGGRSLGASTELYDFVHANIDLEPDQLLKELLPQGQKVLDNKWSPAGLYLPKGIADALADITKYLSPALEAIDQKANSLGWGLKPAGRSKTTNAVRRFSVIEGDDLAVHTRTTKVTWREYSNDSGVVGIYYTAERGAFVVYGGIREKFLALGGVSSYLGFPTSDEQGNGKLGADNRRWSTFDGGTLNWSPQLGAYADVTVNTVTRRYSTWRLTAVDVTGLTPTSQFNVYGVGMYDLPESRRQGFGFATSGADGTYYGFGATELWVKTDAELMKHVVVQEKLSGRTGKSHAL